MAKTMGMFINVSLAVAISRIFIIKMTVNQKWFHVNKNKRIL